MIIRGGPEDYSIPPPGIEQKTPTPLFPAYLTIAENKQKPPRRYTLSTVFIYECKWFSFIDALNGKMQNHFLLIQDFLFLTYADFVCEYVRPCSELRSRRFGIASL